MFERPADTSADAQRAQDEVYRKLGPQGRIRIMFQLNDMVRAIAIAGIRRRHPDYDDEQVKLAFARLTLGDDLVRAAWPDRALVDP
jgi:hypothetical protein